LEAAVQAAPGAAGLELANWNWKAVSTFVQQKYSGPLIVIWDNGPAHRGPATRAYLATADLNLRLVAFASVQPGL
jgi:hypothetical protein